MLPEDQRRLQREADIANAVRGPDYSQYFADMQSIRDDVMKRAESSRHHYAREQAGYYYAAARGEVQKIDGIIPPFRTYSI